LWAGSMVQTSAMSADAVWARTQQFWADRSCVAYLRLQRERGRVCCSENDVAFLASVGRRLEAGNIVTGAPLRSRRASPDVIDETYRLLTQLRERQTTTTTDSE